MRYAPKTATLAESIYRDIDKDQYLNEIYESLLYNYSIERKHSNMSTRA